MIKVRDVCEQHHDAFCAIRSPFFNTITIVIIIELHSITYNRLINITNKNIITKRQIFDVCFAYIISVFNVLTTDY